MTSWLLLLLKLILHKLNFKLNCKLRLNFNFRLRLKPNTKLNSKPKPKLDQPSLWKRRRYVSRFSVRLPSLPTFDASRQLTNLAANARIIHSIYNHMFSARLVSNPELIIDSDGDTRFLAAVILTSPGQDVVMSMHAKNCQSSMEALEKLYAVSRARLWSACNSSKSRGGNLAVWKDVVFRWALLSQGLFVTGGREGTG